MLNGCVCGAGCFWLKLNAANPRGTAFFSAPARILLPADFNHSGIELVVAAGVVRPVPVADGVIAPPLNPVGCNPLVDVPEVSPELTGLEPREYCDVAGGVPAVAGATDGAAPDTSATGATVG